MGATATSFILTESYQTTQSPLESDFMPDQFFSGSVSTATKLSVDFDKSVSVGKNYSGLIREVTGVIVSIKNAMVQIKLGENTFVDFPSELFASKKFINIGQHIKYQLKRDEWGYRYQDLVEDDSVGQADVSDLEELLKDI